jgi:PIN domain nuclease of toxin-antitoxin system
VDTHALLWFFMDDIKLSEAAREIIFDSSARKFVSIASLWEISIKNRIGKLPLANGIEEIFKQIEINGFGIIGITREYVKIYNKLPLIHRDPFDGMIVATAIGEQMTVVTADENIQKYDVSWVW